MPTHLSTAATDSAATLMHSGLDQDCLRRRAGSPTDSEGSSGSDLITYAPHETAKNDPEIRSTRQKVDRRPVSTWYKKRYSDMTLAEKICSLAICPPTIHGLKDFELDRGGPPPYQSVLGENLFVLPRALFPLVLHAACYYLFPETKWPVYVAYPIYFLAFNWFAMQVVSRLNHFAVKLGVFDEKMIGRDRTPDKSVNNLAKGIVAYMFLRTGMDFYLHYDKTVTPFTDIAWTFPIRILVWEIVFDYLFYAYHRSTHEIDALWFVHQHHHTTKHPTAILSILADDYQECLEIFFLPLAASLIVPMSFSEMWITLSYTLYVEMMGHSGVRAYWPHPLLFWLKIVDADGIIEDHDLHHRFGKSGKNYGKQSRLWDRIFGTVGERIETYGM